MADARQLVLPPSRGASNRLLPLCENLDRKPKKTAGGAGGFFSGEWRPP
jgi:hypothetical protein